ncbi:MAG: hypothetical protein KY464_02965, partial [Gemmatimonadetes bacterium]|nr:hypothetical protein [Gemmatimonadota bacterium]
MPSSTPSPIRGEPIARDVRPLPGRPSLEYERKQAKAFLKQIRRGETAALRRVGSSHPAALRGRSPTDLKLADAQHVIAREYGFESWPRLVEYFEELERHRHTPGHNSSDDYPETLEWRVQSIMRRHSRGDALVARELAHYVPRFFARPYGQILATRTTEDDARLVVARQGRRASWEELIERASASRDRREAQRWESANTPSRRAWSAIRAHDADALEAILDEHPELLAPSAIEREWRTPASLAISFELEARTP